MAIASVGAPKGSQNAKKDKEDIKGVDNTFNILKPTRGSSNVDYLLSRIKRDRPDVIPRIGKDKEFSSARAAAIHCGIVKGTKHVTLRAARRFSHPRSR